MIKRLLTQLLELRYLARGPRAYARRRTLPVREVWGRAIRALNPRERRRRALAASALPAVALTIPEPTGILDLTDLDPILIKDVVAEAEELFGSLDIDAIRSGDAERQLYVIPLASSIDHGSAILRLALDPRLLRIVTDYIGVLPVIENIGLWFSPNDRMYEGSAQYLHLDGQDLRTLQLFIHVEPVSADNGPLTAIDASGSEQLAAHIKYRKTAETKRIADDQARELLDGSRFHMLTGEPGTATIVDTDRCFHFGSREGRRRRVLLVIQYYSPFALVLPRNYERALPFATMGRQSEFSALERLVLGRR